MPALIQSLARRKSVATFIAIGAALAVGYLDYITGALSFGLFYLLPISFACHVAQRSGGILTALVCAGCWLVGDLSQGPVSYRYGPYYNTGIHLSVFLVFVELACRLQAMRSTLELQVKQRTAQLEQELHQRRRVEAALADQRAMFRALVDHAPDIIARYDRGLRCLYVNPAVTSLTGKPPDSCIGRACVEAGCGGSFCLGMQRHIREVVQRGVQITVESTHGAHGQERHFQTRLVPELNAAGTVETVLSVSREITALKQSENALRLSEQNFQTLARLAPVGIVKADPAGNVIFVNDRWCQMFGAQEADALGRAWERVLHPEDRAEFLALAQQTLQSGRHLHHECRLIGQDGKVHRTLCEADVERSPSGEILGAVGAVTDLTELRELEEKLQHAQRMESIGRLAGGLAHDFNNLLTPILGYCELAAPRVAGNAVLEKYLNRIQMAAESGATLSRHLLAFGRRQISQPQVLDPNEVLQALHALAKPLAGARIELTTHTRSTRRIRIDAGQLQQVLLNLVVNACDAMQQVGRLSIESYDTQLDTLGRPECRELGAGQYVVIAVSDTGCGISSENMPHIFEPFFTTKERGKGTGLGLAICYGIITQSGGHIAVQSELDQGTTVRVYLPASLETATPIRALSVIERPPQPAPARERETILLAEDDPLVHSVIVDGLAQCGYRVLKSCNGEEALALARAHEGEIDLLLSDIAMPKIGGIELARRLSLERPKMRILLMTGYSEHSEVAGLVHGGILLKPFDTATLGDAVRRALEKP